MAQRLGEATHRPSEDKDWNDYVNSITRAEFLENLLLWESILIDEDSNELG